MTGPVFRAGDRTELRPVEADDLDFVQRLFSEPASRRRRFEPASPRPAAAMESWHEEERDDGEDVFLVTAGGERLGIAQFRWFDRRDGTAVLTWLLDPARDDAEAVDALREMVGWAFEEQRLERLSTGVPVVFDDHDVVEGVGFVEEGRLRQDRYVDGEFVDSVAYGLLREEWEG